VETIRSVELVQETSIPLVEHVEETSVFVEFVQETLIPLVEHVEETSQHLAGLERETRKHVVEFVEEVPVRFVEEAWHCFVEAAGQEQQGSG